MLYFPCSLEYLWKFSSSFLSCVHFIALLVNAQFHLALGLLGQSHRPAMVCRLRAVWSQPGQLSHLGCRCIPDHKPHTQYRGGSLLRRRGPFAWAFPDPLPFPSVDCFPVCCEQCALAGVSRILISNFILILDCLFH